MVCGRTVVVSLVHHHHRRRVVRAVRVRLRERVLRGLVATTTSEEVFGQTDKTDNPFWGKKESKVSLKTNSDFEKSNRSLAYLLNSLPKREAVDAPPPSLSPSPLERFLLSKRQSAGRRETERERQREQERGRALLLFRQKRATNSGDKMPRWKKKKSSLLCSYERTLFFSKCGRVKSFFKLFFHIRNPLSFFFLTGRQKNEEDEEEEEGRRRRRVLFAFFSMRRVCFFLCVASTKRDFCLFWFKQQQSRTKQTNKKERMKKKRGEFFWDQHNTNVVFQFRAAVVFIPPAFNNSTKRRTDDQL